MEETNSQHLHFKIFKPYGYLSQFTNNDVSKHKKKLLGELYEFPENIMAIGRLDEKSEGLLLLTTDGKISDLINSSKIIHHFPGDPGLHVHKLKYMFAFLNGLKTIITSKNN